MKHIACTSFVPFSHHFMKINLPQIPGKILHVRFNIDLLIPYFDPNDFYIFCYAAQHYQIIDHCKFCLVDE